MSKLYTEEQVRKAINLAQKCENDCGGVYFYCTETEVIDELTPIELPTEEDIEKEFTIGNQIFTDRIVGAKWVLDKIKGGGDGM